MGGAWERSAEVENLLLALLSPRSWSILTSPTAIFEGRVFAVQTEETLWKGVCKNTSFSWNRWYFCRQLLYLSELWTEMFKDSVSSFASGFDSCRRHLSLLFKLVPHGHIHPPPQLSNSDVQYRTWFSRLANSSVVVFNWISRLFANSFMRRTAS